ncbi:hypothetical protein NKJ09_22920 [Mesorhizobium sp. M0189]|uniref:hypothetical protein n=1 Tax=Mesorhizobium sp. M0189 TaxID=2956909 RepID=UPI00333724AA
MSIPAGEGARKIPLKPGYYWAKWRIATEGTQDGDELTPSDNWEIVQVVENDPDWEIHPAEEKAMFVFVCGVGEAQWRDGFVWGDFIAPLDSGRGTSPAILSNAQAVPATMGGAGEMVAMPREPTADHLRTLFMMNSSLPRTTDEVKAVYSALLNISAALAGNPSLPSGGEKS